MSDELIADIGDRLAATARAAVSGHLRTEAAHAIVRAVLNEIKAAGLIVISIERFAELKKAEALWHHTESAALDRL